MAKGINKKVVAEVAVKETPKKVMKAEASGPDYGPIRKLFNVVMTKVKGLTLVENKHGAVQIKRSGDLLFSARSNGKLILTAPMYEGKGKDKVRVYKHPGDGWDHFSEIPLDKVTLPILLTRANDPNSGKFYREQIYGKVDTTSGLHRKAEAARERVAKIKASVEVKKEETKTSLREAKKVKETKAKKPATKMDKAIRRVAAKASA